MLFIIESNDTRKVSIINYFLAPNIPSSSAISHREKERERGGRKREERYWVKVIRLVSVGI